MIVLFHKGKNLDGQAGLKQMQSNPTAVVRFLSAPVHQELWNWKIISFVKEKSL